MNFRLLTAPFCLVVVAMMFATTVQVKAGLIGASFGGSIYTINDSTGSAMLLGNSGFSRLNGMASGNGKIYSTSQDGFGGKDTLIEIDSTTGIGTAIADLTLGGALHITNGVRGLAIDSSGTLYATIDDGSAGQLGPDNLYTVNATTGALSLVGASGLTGLQGLAFSNMDTLFGWSGTGLYSVNSANGSATLIGDGGVRLQALEFRSDGVMFGVNDTLFTIDQNSGNPTLIGSTNFDIRGLAFTDAVPEPASLAIFGTIGLIACGRRRKS